MERQRGKEGRRERGKEGEKEEGREGRRERGKEREKEGGREGRRESLVCASSFCTYMYVSVLKWNLLLGHSE